MTYKEFRYNTKNLNDIFLLSDILQIIHNRDRIDYVNIKKLIISIDLDMLKQHEEEHPSLIIHKNIVSNILDGQNLVDLFNSKFNLWLEEYDLKVESILSYHFIFLIIPKNKILRKRYIEIDILTFYIKYLNKYHIFFSQHPILFKFVIITLYKIYTCKIISLN